MGKFENVSRPSKNDPADSVLTISLPPPGPDKKNHPQTQNVSPSILPSPIHCHRDRSHHEEKTQSMNQLCRLHRGFMSGTNNRPLVRSIKKRILSRNKKQIQQKTIRTIWSFPTRSTTNTCVHTMDQDYPFTHPSPGVNQPIHPPFLAPTRRPTIINNCGSCCVMTKELETLNNLIPHGDGNHYYHDTLLLPLKLFKLCVCVFVCVCVCEKIQVGGR